jgi:hypothetical protein
MVHNHKGSLSLSIITLFCHEDKSKYIASKFCYNYRIGMDHYSFQVQNIPSATITNLKVLRRYLRSS